MNLPGRGPGTVREGAACRKAPRLLLAAGGLIAAAVGLVPGPGSGAATTTTTNPWVPGVNGTMTVGIDEAPTGCNPNTVAGDTWADRLVLEAVLPSSFVVNSNDQATYDPATITQAELQSTSPETVVYSINPKAVWADGRPLTAQDFIATWQEERGATGPIGPLPTGKTKTGKTAASSTTTSSPKTSGAHLPTASPAAPPTPTSTSGAATLPGATGTTGPAIGYRQIASMKPSNRGRTFTVTFKRPYADWQSLFNDLLPAHVVKTAGWDPSCTTVSASYDLSAGPYVIGKVVPGREVVLVRNRRWWEPAPPLARITIKVASGPTQLAQWLQRGTIQVALPAGFDPHYLETVSSRPSLVSQSQTSSTFLELQFSTASPLMSPVGFRQAVAHAIDRQALINKVVGWADSTIVPGSSLLFAQSQPGYPAHKPPPLQVSGQPGSTTTTAPSKSPTATPFPPTADLSSTARLLQNLGYFKAAGGSWEAVNGKPLALRMAFDASDTWSQQTAILIARQLDAAGIAVGLVPAASDQAAGMDLSTGKADIALLSMHSSPFPSQAIAWYTTLLGPAGTNGSQDWSGFDDPTVNTLLGKASEELNPVDASPLYAQVDGLLWQHMVGLPLFALPSLLSWSGLTAGVSPNPNGPSLLWSVQAWSMRVPPTSLGTQP